MQIHCFDTTLYTQQLYLEGMRNDFSVKVQCSERYSVKRYF